MSNISHHHLGIAEGKHPLSPMSAVCIDKPFWGIYLHLYGDKHAGWWMIDLSGPAACELLICPCAWHVDMEDRD